MSALTNDQINSVIRSDLNSSVAINDYSPELFDLARDHWENVRNQVTLSSNMICSEVSFRLSSHRPDPTILNFWPATLDLCPFLFRYLKGIFHEHFIKKRKAWRVNFSPSIAIISLVNQTQNFIWASRSNNQALPVSFLIHNQQTFTHFFDVILRQYNLLASLERSVIELEKNYDDGLVCPMTLVFHITVESGRIFGNDDTVYINRGISKSKCKSEENCQQNKCVWLSLSCVYTVKGRKIEKRTARKTKVGTPEKRIAMKLENGFKKWLVAKKNEGHPYTEWKADKGLPEEYLPLLERYLESNIVLIHEKEVGMKKIMYDSIEKTENMKKTFSAEFVSNGNYKDCVYFLTKNNNHVNIITDLDAYMKKYHCVHCGRCFATKTNLMEHRVKKVCEKKRFGGEKLVQFKYSLEKCVEDIEELKNAPITRDLKYGHILVNGTSSGPVSVVMKTKLKNNDSLTTKKEFATLKGGVNYVIKFGALCSVHVLGERMGSNVMFLRELESMLNEYASCDKNNIDTKKLTKLKAIKMDVLNYLGTYDYYVSVGTTDCRLPSSFMYELLSQLSCVHKSEDISTRFEKNMLQTVNVKKYPVKFIMLNNFAPCFSDKVAESNQFQLFENCVQIFKNDLNLNIVGYESATRVGRVLSGNCLTEIQKNMFYSPSEAFYNEVDTNYISCGLLNAKKTAIDIDGTLKSAIAIDMEKYYSSIYMSDCQRFLLTGLPREYAKEGTYFVAKRSRRGKTFSNMVINAIEVGCGSSGSISALNGKECKKFGFFFDAVMDVGGADVFIECNGCFMHSHNTECHSSNVSDEHKMACDVCRTNDAPRDEKNPGESLRPRLWRLKTNEQRSSAHPMKQNMSYDDVHNETERKVQLMYEKTGKKVVSIYECDLLYFWLKNTEHFFSHFGIPLREECRGIQFATFVEQLTMERFPLTKYGKLTEQKVVKAISEGDLNGFVKCSAKCGPKSRTNLGIHTPFFYKNSEGETERSYEVSQKIVSTILLRELLTNESMPDFEVISIDSIFEYQVCGKNPFSKLREPFFSALQKHKDQKGFVSFSKSCINNAIGCYGLNSSRFKRSYIMDEVEVQELQTLHLLSHGTKINDQKRLFHFVSNAQTVNLRAIHMSLVATGIAKMLNFSLQFKHWFLTEFLRTNTDGSIYGFVKPFSDDILNTSRLTSVILDSNLRMKLDINSAMAFLAFKKRHFKDLGVCPNHESDYLKDLVQSRVFYQRPCCLWYTVQNVSINCKLEFLANKGIIYSVNKLSLFNAQTKSYYIKSGGRFDEFLVHIESLSLHDLNMEIKNL